MMARTYHRAGILMGAALLSIFTGSHAMAYGPAALTAKFPAETQILVRISNPQKFRNSLQKLAQTIFIPGELPTLKALEAKMNLPGGINNSAPVYFIMLPGTAGSPALMPVMMISATHPRLVVSRLNPPAPVNGISMVMAPDGTTGYVALRKHWVLFAMHRTPLETMLHQHGSLLAKLSAPEAALLNNSDLSVYVNAHGIVAAYYPMIQAKLRQMEQALKSQPQAITRQQRLGFKMLRRFPAILKQNMQSMTLGMNVRKDGIKTMVMLRTIKGSSAAQFCAALSKMPVRADQPTPAFSTAMSLDMRAPMELMLANLVGFYHFLDVNSIATGGGNTGSMLQAPMQILKIMERKPIPPVVSQQTFVFAPVKKTDAILSMACRISSSHPRALAAAEIKANINSLIAENQNPNAPIRYIATPIKTIQLGGMEFSSANVRWRLNVGPDLGPEAQVVSPLIKTVLSAVYGGSEMRILAGSYRGHVLVLFNLTPAQALEYIAYIKHSGAPYATASSAIAADRAHILPGSFLIERLDPAVEFGQMTSVISRMAGLSQLGNAVVAGKTPQWIMSARGRGRFLEISSFVPTPSLRVCSQQIHRMVAACVMLIMQLRHPAKGA